MSTLIVYRDGKLVGFRVFLSPALKQALHAGNRKAWTHTLRFLTSGVEKWAKRNA